jgi:hypothetical protein
MHTTYLLLLSTCLEQSDESNSLRGYQLQGDATRRRARTWRSYLTFSDASQYRACDHHRQNAATVQFRQQLVDHGLFETG